MSHPNGHAGRGAIQLIFRLLLGGLLAIGVAGSAQARERKAIAGTTVSLAPVAGFEPSGKFAGLEHAQAQASLVVVEFPAEAHLQLSALFGSLESAQTNFAKQNIVIDEAQDIDTGAGKGRLLTGQQKAGGTVFDKWIVLLKGAKTVMITVQAPEDADLEGDDVVAMLKSVSLGAEPTLDQKLAAMPFRIRAAEPFRIVDTFGGLGVLMTVGPLNTDPKGSQPLLIATFQTGGPVAAGQLGSIGERLLKTTRGYEQAEIGQRGEVQFAGSEGAMLGGTIPAESGRKRFLQYMAVGPDGRYVRLIVNADEATFPMLEPAIKAIADSVAFAK